MKVCALFWAWTLFSSKTEMMSHTIYFEINNCNRLPSGMVESAFLEDLKRKSGCGTWRELSAEQDRARSMAGLNEGFPNFKNSMIL